MTDASAGWKIRVEASFSVVIVAVCHWYTAILDLGRLSGGGFLRVNRDGGILKWQQLRQQW